ncbi:molecular chaperone DnaJ, partial [Candidatus Poribacteria bacterium]
MIDHYKLLGVDRKATKQQIKAAFRRLAKLFHPDKNPQNREEAERKFREILIAYQTLANDRTRAAYDRMLEQHELKRRSQAARRPKPPKDPIAQRCEQMLFDLLNGRYEEGVVEYEKLKAELREFDLFKHLSYADARDCEFLLAEAYHV